MQCADRHTSVGPSRIMRHGRARLAMRHDARVASAAPTHRPVAMRPNAAQRQAYVAQRQCIWPWPSGRHISPSGRLMRPLAQRQACGQPTAGPRYRARVCACSFRRHTPALRCTPACTEYSWAYLRLEPPGYASRAQVAVPYAKEIVRSRETNVGALVANSLLAFMLTRYEQRADG